ncbi:MULTISPECIES: ATP-binding protein [Streptomyces]|uniref:ATPase n=2 Tax=Streptomyces TaxID=1883 RepID=A0A2N8PHH8_STRNR|nr:MULTISPECIES: ATP-binding protein [Streptomyces]PNE40494.1 ATPase [Streptomyces noursei]SHM92308.1 Histidine kinase-like ATPase domain-containing protein [Streptomyces yunnanensis]
MFAPLTPLPYRHVLTLPAEPSAVRIARETAELTLNGWGIGLRHPAVGPALLILSELVTNTIRHAAAHSPQVTVIYGASRQRLVFAVHDTHPYQPPLDGPVDSISGGGLAMVRELVCDLGGTAVVRTSSTVAGKGIWITLPL